MQGRVIVCYGCGKELEHGTGRMPCEELEGWITISHWKGKESVDHYSFCSTQCLHQWVGDLFPRVPDVFLNSFGDEDIGDE